MLKRTSVATIIALLLVISISGLYYERSAYRYNDGRPKDDYIDNFVDASLVAGNNFINGISGTMQTMQDIFGFVGGLPIIQDLVGREEKDWSAVEVYEIDYRKERNRYLTDLDVLPPEEYVEIGDELIVRIYCADYTIWKPHRSFCRVWYYDESGYWTDYKCYGNGMYKRKNIFTFFTGEYIRKADTGKYLGICPLGYVEYEKIEWIK